MRVRLPPRAMLNSVGCSPILRGMPACQLTAPTGHAIESRSLSCRRELQTRPFRVPRRVDASRGVATGNRDESRFSRFRWLFVPRNLRATRPRGQRAHVSPESGTGDASPGGQLTPSGCARQKSRLTLSWPFIVPRARQTASSMSSVMRRTAPSANSTCTKPRWLLVGASRLP